MNRIRTFRLDRAGVDRRHHASVTEELRDASKKLDSDLRERKERLHRTEKKMAGLVDVIANGERVQYVGQTLRDLEPFAIQEREGIADLEALASAPLKLPSIAEVEHHVRDLDQRLKQDPEAARQQLRRRLREGSVGEVVAEGGLLSLMAVENAWTPQKVLPETNPLVSGR